MDGANFTHKINPFDQVRAPRAIGRRKLRQGFDFSFTGKGIHEGTEGNIAHIMAAIANGKGVIALKLYHGRTNAENFSFVREHFASMFKKSATESGNFSCRMVILHITV